MTDEAHPSLLRVLLVEDDADGAELVARALRKHGFALDLLRTDSRDGFLRALAEDAWDVIIADYSLPGFSGVEALGLARDARLDVPFLIVSGTISDETAVAAMRAGAADYVMKDNLARLGPAVDRELQEAAQRRRRREAERQAASAQEEARVQAQLLAAERTISETLQAGLSMLPEEIAGLRFAHLYRSATEQARVGGDFYDIFTIRQNRVGILIGDVCGHGVEAARMAASTRDTIRAYAYEDGSTSQVLRLTNVALLRTRARNAFVTVFFAILDLTTDELLYASAGHPAGLLGREDGSVEQLHTGSPPLGIFGDLEFSMARTTLTPSDLLVVYTDGLIEARVDGELFGDERLSERLAQVLDRDLDEVPGLLLDAVVAFAGDQFSDDVAIVAVRRSPADTSPG